MSESDVYENNSKNLLHAYWHAKSAKMYWDAVVSDRTRIDNKDMLKIIITARSSCSIFIKAMEKSFLEAGIDLTTLQGEENLLYEAMECIESKMDRIEVKFKPNYQILAVNGKKTK